MEAAVKHVERGALSVESGGCRMERGKHVRKGNDMSVKDYKLNKMMEDAFSWRHSSSVSNASAVASRSTLNALSGNCRTLRAPLSAQRAFTLIEVLVAMTVLAIMVLMAANIFQSSSSAWNIGIQKAEMNTAARAALDFMARELQSAVAGPIETVASGAQPLEFILENGNEVRFVSLLGEPENGGRALKASLFMYENNILKYWRNTGLFNPYTHIPAWDSSALLITNVLSLQIRAFTNEYGLANGLDTEDFNSSDPANSNQLPLCVDIAIEMISDSDMKRYNELTGVDQNSFAARHAKVYSTRVYFPNRRGYGGR